MSHWHLWTNLGVPDRVLHIGGSGIDLLQDDGLWPCPERESTAIAQTIRSHVPLVEDGEEFGDEIRRRRSGVQLTHPRGE